MGPSRPPGAIWGPSSHALPSSRDGRFASTRGRDRDADRSLVAETVGSSFLRGVARAMATLMEVGRWMQLRQGSSEGDGLDFCACQRPASCGRRRARPVDCSRLDDRLPVVAGSARRVVFALAAPERAWRVVAPRCGSACGSVRRENRRSCRYAEVAPSVQPSSLASPVRGLLTRFRPRADSFPSRPCSTRLR